MTIGEAIKIKERKGDEFLQTDPDDIDEADRLLIEAGKRLELGRGIGLPRFDALLPGETEE